MYTVVSSYLKFQILSFIFNIDYCNTSFVIQLSFVSYNKVFSIVTQINKSTILDPKTKFFMYVILYAVVVLFNFSHSSNSFLIFSYYSSPTGDVCMILTHLEYIDPRVHRYSLYSLIIYLILFVDQ